MSTRSSTRNLFPALNNPELTIRRRSRAEPTLLNDFEMVIEGNGDPPVPDLQTMEELCQPSLNGRVQNSCQFHDLLGDDANKHLDKFLHVTQSIKVNRVTDDAIRLKLRNEITNFRQRPNESLFEAWEHYKLSIDRCPNHNMLPVTQIDTFYNGLTLRHRDIINATAGGSFMKRRLEECYDLIEDMTAHHNDWDTSAQRTTVGNTQNVYVAGAYQGNSYQVQGNCNLISYHSDNYLGPPGFNKNQNQNNQNQNFHNPNRNQGNHNPQGNNQGRSQFFQGASHGQNPPLAYQAPAYLAPGYQALIHQPQIPQSQVVTTNEFTNFMKANDAILKNMQTNMTSLTNSNIELKNMFGQFMKMNTTSSSSLGTLLGNTITNPNEDLKGITTRSGTAYQGPTIPTTFSSFPPVVERETKLRRCSHSNAQIWCNNQNSLTNKEKLFGLARTPLNEHCSAVLLKKLPEKLRDLGKFLIPCDFPRMAECLALADLDASINLRPLSVWNKLSLLDLSHTCMTLELADRSISHPAITFNLDQTSRYSTNYNDMTVNQYDVIDMDREEYSQEVLGFSDVIASGNPTPYYDPIVSTTSPTLTLLAVLFIRSDGHSMFSSLV
nr:hypothetical protein [Tanacetum cinerariifolium]